MKRKLEDAIRTYLQIDRRDLTNKQYGYVLRAMCGAIGPKNAVSSITYEILLGYQSRLRQRLAPSTVAAHTSVIKSFFAWAVNRGYTAASPAADLVRRRISSHESRAIAVAELNRIVEYTRVTSARNYALLLFLADTGCRVGGLLSLTRLNLHLDEGFAFLLEKGGVWHRALFGEVTGLAMQRWLEQRPQCDHDYVWTGKGPKHEPLKRGAITYLLHKLSRETGASREWGPHSIRHAVGHAWAKAGQPPTVTARKLGHSSVATTMQHYYPQDDPYLEAVSRRMSLASLKGDSEPVRPVPLEKARRVSSS